MPRVAMRSSFSNGGAPGSGTWIPGRPANRSIRSSRVRFGACNPIPVACFLLSRSRTSRASFPPGPRIPGIASDAPPQPRSHDTRSTELSAVPHAQRRSRKLALPVSSRPSIASRARRPSGDYSREVLSHAGHNNLNISFAVNRLLRHGVQRLRLTRNWDALPGNRKAPHRPVPSPPGC